MAPRLGGVAAVILLVSAVTAPSASAQEARTCPIDGVTYSTASPPPGLNVVQPGGTPSTGRQFVGTDGPDLIIGTDGNDILEGFGGNDVICGRGGDDRLTGGDGDDRLDGGPGSTRCSRGSTGPRRFPTPA